MKIVPNLWFDRQAEQAARCYVHTFERSRVERMTAAFLQMTKFDLRALEASFRG